MVPALRAARFSPSSVAIADERRGRAMDATAILLALAEIDRDDLDAVVHEALCGAVAVVDREQNLARPHREHVGHAGIVRMVHLDPFELELLHRVQKPPR